MSYLHFDKTTMTNLEESLPREILRTNRSGAYSSSTIVACNTRKYHGLLVIPIPELDDENHVLLSSLDETVIQHGAEFNLGLHKYQGDNYSPKGHKYIRSYDCETVPKTTFRVGGVILTKEKLLVHHENRILIRYTLVDAHSPTKLRFRPFMAFRSVREYTHENPLVDRNFVRIDGGINTCMYADYPSLYMQFSKQNEFHFEPYWYKGIEYTKEQERGYHFNEDLYVPGFFEMDIRKGESIIFSAGITEMDTSTLKGLYKTEYESRTPRNGFDNCLRNAAHQFHNKQGEYHYILAGYPWFNCRARDMFVSLPGLTLALGEREEFHSAMRTAEKALREFMERRYTGLKIYEIEHPDVPLWCVWALQQYAKHVGKEQCKELYGCLLRDIIDFVRKGGHSNIQVHDNRLLYVNGKDTAVSWMNSTAYGRPVVPRTGYLVEFNALWFNALRFTADLYENNEAYAAELNATADKCGESFVATFLNEYGYLLDYVDGAMMDWSVRPNMIFAIALDYSPLDRKQKKGVLDTVTKELLTPKGLRSLSPKSGGYNPNYVGRQEQRDFAYHQGTAWPWLMGFYLEAYVRIYKMSGLSFIERQLDNFESEMTQHCIGTISELYDGNPPFIGRGATSFAMNIAEILRARKLLAKLNEALTINS